MSANRPSAVKAARVLLKSYPSSELQKPVRALARASGCIVKLTPLEEALSGMAFVKEGLRAIVVNSTHHPNRQRFTIAHELGHHLLHFPMLQKGVHVDKAIFRRDLNSSTGRYEKEIEANQFAAELLMPAETVKLVIPPDFDLQDEDRLQGFASMFGVSAAALSFRIQNIFGK